MAAGLCHSRHFLNKLGIYLDRKQMEKTKRKNYIKRTISIGKVGGASVRWKQFFSNPGTLGAGQTSLEHRRSGVKNHSPSAALLGDGHRNFTGPTRKIQGKSALRGKESRGELFDENLRLFEIVASMCVTESRGMISSGEGIVHSRKVFERVLASTMRDLFSEHVPELHILSSTNPESWFGPMSL